jgi:hypothetical protein
VVRAIIRVTLAAPDPVGLARRWAEVLGLPTPHAQALALDPGVIRFVAGREDAIAAIGLATTDPARALAAARERGLSTEEHSVFVGGVRFELQ